MTKNVQQELKKLRNRVRQLEGGDKQSAVSELVGTQGMMTGRATEEDSKRIDEQLAKHLNLGTMKVQ